MRIEGDEQYVQHTGHYVEKESSWLDSPIKIALTWVTMTAISAIILATAVLSFWWLVRKFIEFTAWVMM